MYPKTTQSKDQKVKIEIIKLIEENVENYL